MPRYTDAELLAYAEALDRAYAEADAFDRAQAPTVTAWRIEWDNGESDCGVFPWTFATEAEAERFAEDTARELIATGAWSEEGGCDVFDVQIPAPAEPVEDEMALLQRAALSRGQP